MTGISDVTTRIHAIQSRVDQLDQLHRSSSDGERLGFGLALEQALAESPAASDAVASTALHPDAGASAATALARHGSAHTAHGATSTGLTPADPTGPFGRLSAPPELAAFGNGQVPSQALAPVGDTGHRLHAPAAAALTRLLADARAAGIEIGITDSYRPLDVQHRLAEEKGLYSQGGLAATPGTSNHGWGLSTDLDLDDRALAWMRDHAWRYGFVEDVPREPWHWTYRPATT